MSNGDFLGTWLDLAQLWWTRHGAALPRAMGEYRLKSLVRHARAHSPFYARLYQGLPEDPALDSLPRTNRAQLMAHFDDWATDRKITLRAARAFLKDKERIGEPFLGRYTVWKSSGTSGVPGIFVQDAEALSAYDALLAMQLEEAAWSPPRTRGALASGGRIALVAAIGDHFAGIASWERLRHQNPSGEAAAFSILEPLDALVAQLNAFAPATLASYPSTLALLAAERAAGRLAIEPALIWSGGEVLAPATRSAIEAAFGCTVMNEYGASECLSIAHECTHGWMHLHAEWALLEGVEDDGAPTPPGRLSHTTLLTNLANGLQPVIRYDLGDRILTAASPCACGSPLPAFRVLGRCEATLELRSGTGQAVPLVPLAISTVVEEALGSLPFQIVQQGPTRLGLRLGHGANRRGAVERARRALHAWLSTQSLGNVELAWERSDPRIDATTGKLPSVVAEHRRGA
jgi:phenylacetate-CoA ligase